MRLLRIDTAAYGEQYYPLEHFQDIGHDIIH